MAWMADLDPARTSTVFPRSGLNLRLVAFTLLVIAAVLVGAAYLVNAALRAAPAGGSSVAPAGLGYDGPMLMFIHAAGDQDFGKLAFVPADDPSATRTTSSMHCERVHYAAGRGLCLVLELGLVSRYRALAFGPDLQTTAAIDLDGLPSRTRISPDGRYGAVTVFVSGHSYASDDFSTRTTIIDLDRGVTIGDLESFTTMRDGTPWRAQDFNFWGITFTHADSNRFYATLRTGEDIYLVEGDVAAQRLDVVGEAIECPAISPDDTRLAFKKRQPDGFTWRLSVLDLATGAQTQLAETRDVDDQPEWLDDDWVMYAAEASVWRARADGTGEPELVVKSGLSPTLISAATISAGVPSAP
jgi:hypothetical protein